MDSPGPRKLKRKVGGPDFFGCLLFHYMIGQSIRTFGLQTNYAGIIMYIIYVINNNIEIINFGN